MNRQTTQTLNRINRDFYRNRAVEFSATRQKPWRGWKRLVQLMEEHFEGIHPPSVLDLGCGNGRFARFLRDHYSKSISYVGVDVSAQALEHARTHLVETDTCRLIQHDLVADRPEEILPREAQRPFSLIAAFGLFHHLPSYELRRAVLAELARRLEPQGILAISIWQFGRFERFRRKVLSWQEFQSQTGVILDTTQLEHGDYVLTWGSAPPAFRYCHYIDPEEASRLTSSLPLIQMATFAADGATHNLNQYHVLKNDTCS